MKNTRRYERLRILSQNDKEQSALANDVCKRKDLSLLQTRASSSSSNLFTGVVKDERLNSLDCVKRPRNSVVCGRSVAKKTATSPKRLSSKRAAPPLAKRCSLKKASCDIATSTAAANKLRVNGNYIGRLRSNSFLFKNERFQYGLSSSICANVNRPIHSTVEKMLCVVKSDGGLSDCISTLSTRLSMKAITPNADETGSPAHTTTTSVHASRGCLPIVTASSDAPRHIGASDLTANSSVIQSTRNVDVYDFDITGDEQYCEPQTLMRSFRRSYKKCNNVASAECVRMKTFVKTEPGCDLYGASGFLNDSSAPPIRDTFKAEKITDHYGACAIGDLKLSQPVLASLKIEENLDFTRSSPIKKKNSAPPALTSVKSVKSLEFTRSTPLIKNEKTTPPVLTSLKNEKSLDSTRSPLIKKKNSAPPVLVSVKLEKRSVPYTPSELGNRKSSPPVLKSVKCEKNSTSRRSHELGNQKSSPLVLKSVKCEKSSTAHTSHELGNRKSSAPIRNPTRIENSHDVHSDRNVAILSPIKLEPVTGNSAHFSTSSHIKVEKKSVRKPFYVSSPHILIETHYGTCSPCKIFPSPPTSDCVKLEINSRPACQPSSSSLSAIKTVTRCYLNKRRHRHQHPTNLSQPTPRRPPPITHSTFAHRNYEHNYSKQSAMCDFDAFTSSTVVADASPKTSTHDKDGTLIKQRENNNDDDDAAAAHKTVNSSGVCTTSDYTCTILATANSIINGTANTNKSDKTASICISNAAFYGVSNSSSRSRRNSVSTSLIENNTIIDRHDTVPSQIQDVIRTTNVKTCSADLNTQATKIANEIGSTVRDCTANKNNDAIMKHLSLNAPDITKCADSFFEDEMHQHAIRSVCSTIVDETTSDSLAYNVSLFVSSDEEDDADNDADQSFDCDLLDAALLAVEKTFSSILESCSDTDKSSVSSTGSNMDTEDDLWWTAPSSPEYSSSSRLEQSPDADMKSDRIISEIATALERCAIAFQSERPCSDLGVLCDCLNTFATTNTTLYHAADTALLLDDCIEVVEGCLYNSKTSAQSKSLCLLAPSSKHVLDECYDQEVNGPTSSDNNCDYFCPYRDRQYELTVTSDREIAMNSMQSNNNASLENLLYEACTKSSPYPSYVVQDRIGHDNDVCSNYNLDIVEFPLNTGNGPVIPTLPDDHSVNAAVMQLLPDSHTGNGIVTQTSLDAPTEVCYPNSSAEMMYDDRKIFGEMNRPQYGGQHENRSFERWSNNILQTGEYGTNEHGDYVQIQQGPSAVYVGSEQGSGTFGDTVVFELVSPPLVVSSSSSTTQFPMSVDENVGGGMDCIETSIGDEKFMCEYNGECVTKPDYKKQIYFAGTTDVLMTTFRSINANTRKLITNLSDRISTSEGPTNIVMDNSEAYFCENFKANQMNDVQNTTPMDRVSCHNLLSNETMASCNDFDVVQPCYEDFNIYEYEPEQCEVDYSIAEIFDIDEAHMFGQQTDQEYHNSYHAVSHGNDFVRPSAVHRQEAPPHPRPQRLYAAGEHVGRRLRSHTLRAHAEARYQNNIVTPDNSMDEDSNGENADDSDWYEDNENMNF